MITYDLTSDLGRVRFAIGDTVADAGVKPDGTNFSDEELDALLTSEGSVAGAVAAALEALARMWASMVDITVGPRSERLGQVASQYATAAASARSHAATLTPQSSTMPTSTTATPNVAVW